MGKHRCPFSNPERDDVALDVEEDVEQQEHTSSSSSILNPPGNQAYAYDKPLKSTNNKHVRLEGIAEEETEGTVTADPEPHSSQSVPALAQGEHRSRRLRSKTSVSDQAPLTPVQELSTSLRKLHERLANKDELLKLHLKHYHMSARQFKLRTSELKLPEQIHIMYKDICDKCETCQKHKPAPHRSRISGLRATEFGDLVFIDHGSMKIEALNFQFLVLLDAATMFIQVYAVKSTGADESISCVREYMDTYHCKPRTIVSDAGFQTDEWQTLCRKNGIKALPYRPVYTMAKPC